MKKFLLITLLQGAILWSRQSNAELIVVVNENSPINEITPRDLSAIYLGKKHYYPSEFRVEPLDFEKHSKMRDVFYQKLVGKSSAQINAYWARLLFTGKAEPPIEYASQSRLIEQVKNNANAIAYIDNKGDISGLKVIYRFENIK